MTGPAGSPGSPDAVLVVAPARVSELVMAQCLFKALRHQAPQAAIDVLAPARGLPLLSRMSEVRYTIELPAATADRWRLGRSLRGRYRQAIVLPDAWQAAVVPFAAGIGQRTGWRGLVRGSLLNDRRRTDRSRCPTTAHRFAALAAPAGAPLPAIEPPRFEVKVADVQDAMQRLDVRKSAQRRVLALCPGAEFGPARQWPTVHYAELGRQFGQRGWDIWLFGSEADRAITDGVAATCKVVTNLVGRTTLAQAVDLMSVADAVVSNDSGLMHIAAALDRPLVALYGASDPALAPPMGTRHRVVRLGLTCSPCNKCECPLGTTACLVDLPATDVAAALDALTG
jgi:heptosyltransferase-2